MPVVRRVAAVCLAAGLAMSTSTAASANTHDKLRHARHHAAQLDARARHQAAQVAAARHTLARLDARANAALAALQQARLTADRARAASDLAEAQLAAARSRTDAARAVVNATAAGAYRTMASGGSFATTLSLVQNGDPQAFLNGLQVLGQVGKRQGAVVDDLRVAEAAQLRSEHLVVAATARAVAAERAAAVAKQHAATLVAQQQREVARERRLLSHTRAAAANAHAQARELERRIAAARARAAAIRRAQALRAANGPIPKCDGASIAGYPNGQLPPAALCALWGAPGMMLQRTAADAFNRMSHAYAAVFGVPLCVTSSYRTYQHQVELYATMPAGYAAVPGTSNHGWGLAVDLCGGIQVDNSPEHIWLIDHAAGFGWFHPSWALPGGPGPHEPWHWEFAG